MRWNGLNGALLCATALGLVGCFAPASRAQQVTSTARELNLAARFGRLDVAAEKTAQSARTDFLERRADWGRQVRVLDVELSGMDMEDRDSASITVDVAWMRMDEGVLRSTRIGQTYERDQHGWQLTRERRLSGDLGLFGEKRPQHPARPALDVHFRTKTIRE